MNRKLKLVNKIGHTIVEYIRLHRESNGASFSEGFRFVVSWGLSFVLFSVIASIINLPNLARQVLVVVLSVIVGGIVTIKPRFALRVVCIVLALIGFTFIVVSLYTENITKLGFDAGLLGAGTSVMAIAIAVYALLIQTQQEKGKEGYVWIEEIKKFRCEYCKHSGRDCCYKTFSGIKGHIAREHVKRKI